MITLKPLKTGKLRHRIVVYQMQKTGHWGDFSEDERKDTKVGTFWANVESRTGSLLKGRTADTVLSETTHIITMRYTKKLTPDCYIMFKGKRFNIDYISDPDFTGQFLEVFCRVLYD